MEMRTMYEHEINEFGETIEIEYLVPLKVIEQYVNDYVEESDVDTFLKSEYISDDTTNIISDCEDLNYHYELVHEEIIGTYY